MKKGDVILIPFPFTDLTGSKLRPAVVLYASREDIMLVFITSNIANPEPLDMQLTPNPHNRLKQKSLLKTGKIATLHVQLAVGKIGQLTPQELDELNVTSHASSIRFRFQAHQQAFHSI